MAKIAKMNYVQEVCSGLSDHLAATHRVKHSGFKIINGLVGFLRETDGKGPAYDDGIKAFTKVILDSALAKEENWQADEKKAKAYLRQFVYDARQCLAHGLVTDKGVIVDDKGTPLETHRQVRKVTEAKRQAAATPNSASRTTGGQGKTLGEVAFNKATAALEPLLPSLVEHGQLQNLAAWLEEKTGYTVSIYKK